MDCLVVESELPELEWEWVADALDEPIVLYTDTEPAAVADEVVAAADTFVPKRAVSESRRFLLEKVIGVTTTGPTEAGERRRSAAEAVAADVGSDLVAFLVDDSGTVRWSNRTFAEAFPLEEMDVSLPDTDDFDANLAALFDNDPDAVAEFLSGTRSSRSDPQVFGLPVGNPTRFYLYHSSDAPAEVPATRVDVFQSVTGAVEEYEDLEMLEQLVGNVEDGLYVLDADARVVYCNRAYAEAFGYEPAELVGTHASKTMAKGQLEKGQELLERLWESDADSEVTELEFVTRDGTRIRRTVHFSLRTRDDQYAGILGVVRHPPEPTGTAMALARHRPVVQAAGVPMGLVDADGRVQIVNQRLAEITGKSPDELGGTDFMGLLRRIALEGSDGVIGAIQRSFDGKTGTAELLATDGTDSPTWFELTAAPIDADEPAGAVVTFERRGPGVGAQT